MNAEEYKRENEMLKLIEREIDLLTEIRDNLQYAISRKNVVSDMYKTEMWTWLKSNAYIEHANTIQDMSVRRWKKRVMKQALRVTQVSNTFYNEQ